MKVSISWLKEYVDITLPIEELAERLTLAGLEVGAIHYVGLPGADLEWDREKLVLGHILKVEQHPEADRLVLATADIGTAEPETVVTGAPNLFEYVDQGDISFRPRVMHRVNLESGWALRPYAEAEGIYTFGTTTGNSVLDNGLRARVEGGLDLFSPGQFRRQFPQHAKVVAAPELPGGDNRLALHLVQGVFQFVQPVSRVDTHHDRADFGSRVLGQAPFVAVGRPDADTIPGRDIQGQQATGQAIDLALVLAVSPADALVAHDEGLPVRELRRGPVEGLADGFVQQRFAG